QLQALQEAIKSELASSAQRFKTTYEAALEREKLLREAFESQKQEANQLNESAIQYNLLKRDFESNKQLYDGLLQRLKEAGVSAGLRSSNIRVVDPALAPTAPSGPHRTRDISL